MRHPRRPRQHVDHPRALRRAQYAKARRRIERALGRGDSVQVVADDHLVVIRKPVAA